MFPMTRDHDFPIQSQYYYHNYNILEENGDTLPVYNCLAKLKIKQVKELSFKRGKAGYSREVYNAIKYINSRVPDGHQANNDLENHEVIYYYKIGEEKYHTSKISTKAAYLKIVENQTVDQRYKSKWEEYLNLTDYRKKYGTQSTTHYVIMR